MLDGRHGEAAALAMRILLDMARVWEAERLIDVTSAHIDSCLYHGPAGLDFAERLLAGGAHVRVPATLNVSSLDLLHPGLVRLDADTASIGASARWMPTSPWAAGPPGRAPRTNSNSGRRSASTSRGPNRTRSCSRTRCWARARTATATSSTSARPSPDGSRRRACISTSTGAAASCSGWRTTSRGGCFTTRSRRRASVTSSACGCRHRVPVIVGLPAETSEDRLKALGAAAASSGAVAMFHAVGSRPRRRRWTMRSAAACRARDRRHRRPSPRRPRRADDRRGRTHRRRQRRHAASLRGGARCARHARPAAPTDGPVLREHRTR